MDLNCPIACAVKRDGFYFKKRKKERKKFARRTAKNVCFGLIQMNQI